MKITEYIKQNILYLDGGMGTLLQSEGLMPGELPERWNLTRPATIRKIHKEYYDAGSNVVNTNTFGANPLKLSSCELRQIVASAISIAREAADESVGEQPKWVALDIGPTGKMLKPYGDLDFEDAVSAFAEVIKLGVEYGADLVFIETMNDSYETKAALLAAKENSDLPVFVSNAYGEDGKLMTGADPLAMIAMLEGMGADAIGVNCSLGPKMLIPVVKKYLEFSSLPVIVKPNAGLPRAEGEKTVYDVAPDDFAEDMRELCGLGASILGGCCGTTPEYIKATKNATRGMPYIPVVQKNDTVVSSYTHAVRFGDRPILIGERINPTGKPKFKDALRSGDMGYILSEGIAEAEQGADILDVNVGLPGIDECTMLTRSVYELQSVLDLPLQIDTSDTQAMESALRIYNGKPMINSVSGKRESLDAVLPLAKKYGGLIVALTLDEQGIPADAEGRVAIAEKILAAADEYGIAKKNIIFDPLAMAVSADPCAAIQTLRAVKIINEQLGCHTSLGISNVSFGLPSRDVINSSYFTMALSSGLSAAIMNPHSVEMMKAYHAHLALSGKDESFSAYISFASKHQTLISSPSVNVTSASSSGENLNTGDEFSPLFAAITKGLKEKAAAITSELLNTKAGLDVVKEEIIPALDAVGVGFEKKTVYLPGLLMSAEAAKAAFEVIKAKMNTAQSGTRCSFVLATVKGDIHDIGKNIVKLLLENYGFAVSDLGRDVAPERIVEEAKRLHAPIVGLSALMTTTVPAMAETIKLLRDQLPECKIIVGGAVLTADYAATIGADKYAKDAMETVRYAEQIDAEFNK